MCIPSFEAIALFTHGCLPEYGQKWLMDCAIGLKQVSSLILHVCCTHHEDMISMWDFLTSLGVIIQGLWGLG